MGGSTGILRIRENIIVPKISQALILPSHRAWDKSRTKVILQNDGLFLFSFVLCTDLVVFQAYFGFVLRNTPGGAKGILHGAPGIKARSTTCKTSALSPFLQPQNGSLYGYIWILRTMWVSLGYAQGIASYGKQFWVLPWGSEVFLERKFLSNKGKFALSSWENCWLKSCHDIRLRG